jgi:hypothetical protein
VGSRVGVALVACVVLGWLGVMERDARLQARGTEAAGRLHVPGNFARAEADFRAARLLNPDTAPDVSRAFLYRQRGRRPEAVSLLENVVRREPDNRAAWGVLLTFARGYDADVEQRALAALERLDPLNTTRRTRSAPR